MAVAKATRNPKDAIMQRTGKLRGRRMRKTTVPSFLPQQQEEETDQVRDPGQRSRVYRIYNSGEVSTPLSHFHLHYTWLTGTSVTELEKEDLISAREEQRRQHCAEIRSHRTAMKELEEEIAPRAEPGTHERRLEKRREAAAANREFAQAKRGGSPVEAVPDEDLMGGGDNDLEALKKQREKVQRKKNEREIRREEMLRARAAEREERLRKYRQKEEETMGWLKALAKQRFG